MQDVPHRWIELYQGDNEAMERDGVRIELKILLYAYDQ